MGSRRRSQYTRNALSHKHIAVVMLLAGAVPIHAGALARPLEEPRMDLTHVEWEVRLRNWLQWLWGSFDHWPEPPRLENSIGTWCTEFNLAYAVHSARLVDPTQKEAVIARIFETINHLESDPARLDPLLYEETMGTLLSMLEHLGGDGHRR
jgi:hypothetical protein